MKAPNTPRLLLGLSLLLLLPGLADAEGKPNADAILQAAQGLMAGKQPAAPSAKPEQDAIFQATQRLLEGKSAPPTPTAPAAGAGKAAAPSPTSYGTVVTEKTAGGSTITHFKVEEGASLSAIAFQVYGDPLKYQLIYDANRQNLDSPDHVRAGTLLRLPPK